ncbi:ATP-dependent zinc metalloprotease FtsH [Biomaibacter acetigenes]|uniref:ATP-dependent zinc metalloprotease FtsH n=1 Tax=Biomaibacter acetigenes TaxID=2316383 RepID=A0A3G2R8U1_9FIRM|nr:ATP-dependent zinc metalloprotease FtsH [Biomaibacter acetigenes]AYO31881.1 ATP-dependent zinc metalloprotease FtsH [Biomaibacter acetigenes]MDN5312177.1 cell division protease FtsH [Thermoanaerobacteraceae bacterium]RKL62416.1 ATP-dependent metallopeptidase FtsH/Yme1/Tma family protein [Thermoanaerobacteraceae bacterium SP2]
MNNFFRSISFYLLIFILILSLVQWYSNQDTTQVRINYTELIQLIDKNQVKNIKMVDNNISGTLKDGRNFVSYVPEVAGPLFIEKIQPKVDKGELTFDAEPRPQTPWWSSILPSVFLVLLFIVVWYFFMQQSQGGGSRVMSFGRSRAKLHTDDKRRVTFKDVAGVDEAKEELEEVVEFLKHPKKFIEIGARIPKGVLLIGPPGTGKTLLARAVAGEAGVPFFSISGSDFVEMFVGVGAARVRDLFEQAKKNAPCIVFIDEIDAVGRQRGAGLGGGHDEREQTLNQLLVEMDGFGVNEGIIILAATNRPDILDPALLRPGRFDREVVVDRPDVKGREEILKVHARNKPLNENVDLSVLARRTPGFTGADLENLMNEAALLSARRNKKKIDMPELEEAITRVIAGPEKKSRIMTDRERRLVAYHEAGHAVVAQLLPHVDPVHEVSIVPRGRAGGYTMILPKEDRFFMGKSELMDQVTHLLGGRASEELVLNEVSTGAQNDLERATEIARRMVMEYGMSENLGPMTLGHKQEEVFLGRDLTRGRNYSEEVAASIDKEVRNIIDKCYIKAKTLLSENVNKLHKVAQALLEREKLDEEEFLEVFASA